jgi:membrane protein required for colicin V production
MNFFDFIIVALIALFVINGLRKGIIISLATLAALILGIWVAVHFSNYLDATLVDNFHPSRKWLPILSFTITFLLVVIGVLIVARLMEKLVDLVGLGLFNRIGGALLGLIKGVILVSVIIFLVAIIDPKGKWFTQEDKKGSFFYSRVEPVFPKMMKAFGGEIKFPGWQNVKFE